MAKSCGRLFADDCATCAFGGIILIMIIKRLKLSEIKEIFRKYLVHDFPIEERRPIQKIGQYFLDRRYTGYGGYDEKGQLLCYAFFYIHSCRAKDPMGKTVSKRICLLDYLAVMKTCRGGGIGTAFLDELAKSLSKKENMVLVETENPEYAENAEDRLTKERRMDFYYRNGMIDTGVLTQVFGMEYKIIELDLAAAGKPSWEPHDKEEVMDAVKRMYRSFFTKSSYERRVNVR